MPGVKLIGVRVTLVRGPDAGLRPLDPAGASDASDAPGSGAAGAGEAGRRVSDAAAGSVVRTGEGTSDDVVDGEVAPGTGELVGATRSGSEVGVASRGLVGICPAKFPLTRTATATTNATAATPMRPSSTREVRCAERGWSTGGGWYWLDV